MPDEEKRGPSLGKVIAYCTSVLVMSVTASSTLLYLHADGERTARAEMQSMIQKRLDDGFNEAREDIREIRADVKMILHGSGK